MINSDYNALLRIFIVSVLLTMADYCGLISWNFGFSKIKYYVTTLYSSRMCYARLSLWPLFGSSDTRELNSLVITIKHWNWNCFGYQIVKRAICSFIIFFPNSASKVKGKENLWYISHLKKLWALKLHYLYIIYNMYIVLETAVLS